MSVARPLFHRKRTSISDLALSLKWDFDRLAIPVKVAVSIDA
jgi:hypothetical protein